MPQWTRKNKKMGGISPWKPHADPPKYQQWGRASNYSKSLSGCRKKRKWGESAPGNPMLTPPSPDPKLTDHQEMMEDDIQWINDVLTAWECMECGEDIQKVLMQDCSDCGRGVGEQELHLTLQGYDVVGLFPAMTSETTGRIIRKIILKSALQVRGFCWRQAARYVQMNRRLTGD